MFLQIVQAIVPFGSQTLISCNQRLQFVASFILLSKINVDFCGLLARTITGKMLPVMPTTNLPTHSIEKFHKPAEIIGTHLRCNHFAITISSSYQISSKTQDGCSNAKLSAEDRTN